MEIWKNFSMNCKQIKLLEYNTVAFLESTSLTIMNTESLERQYFRNESACFGAFTCSYQE